MFEGAKRNMWVIYVSILLWYAIFVTDYNKSVGIISLYIFLSC